MQRQALVGGVRKCTHCQNCCPGRLGHQQPTARSKCTRAAQARTCWALASTEQVSGLSPRSAMILQLIHSEPGQPASRDQSWAHQESGHAQGQPSNACGMQLCMTAGQRSDSRRHVSPSLVAAKQGM